MLRIGFTMRVVNPLENERGAALVIGLMFLAIVALAGSTAVILTSTDIQIGSNYKSSSAAFYNADGGLNFALAKIKTGLKANPPTFPAGTTLDAMNVGDITTLSYTVPTGFSFSISTIEKIGTELYAFTSTGNSPDGAQVILKLTFRPVSPSLFNFGVFGDESVTLRGNGYSDSYNSNYGPWTGEGVNTNGDIGTNATSASAIRVRGNNAQVYGGAQIGPGGDTSTAIVTHSAGQISGSKSAMDEEKDMTCVTCPGGGGSGSGLTSFNAGIYNFPSIALSAPADEWTINGDVIFCVSGSINIAGQGEIAISAGSSLKIYVSGNVHLAGRGVTNNTGLPENMQLYGTSTCGAVNIAGQNAFYGAVFACNADVLLSGQGDVYGAICGNTIDISGNGSVHYDEALNKISAANADDVEIVTWERQYP
jgi:hypothetical protein